MVWKARDTELNRFVAIRVLPSERIADSTRRARFDTVHADGAECPVMEFLDGKTLDQ